MNNERRHDGRSSNGSAPQGGGGGGVGSGVAGGAIGDDWAYCVEALLAVSRSFSKPIELLPESLRVSVTCGYLLCRIADTVEDNETLQPHERDAILETFLAVLERNAPPRTFVDAFARISSDKADAQLCRNLDRVMRVFRAQPIAQQEACVPWIGEMARGMALYGHRPKTDEGLAGLTTLADLERYCYFVAGTVGHLLTELFLLEVGNVELSRRQTLQRLCEEFGLGLQLVNILKDVTDDWSRGVCYVPATLLHEQGLTRQTLLDKNNRAQAHAAVAPMFARAKVALDNALHYTLAIPPSAMQVRLFCLVPMFMAARTLVLARGNDAQFVAGEPVKISRTEVSEIIAACMKDCANDAGLRDTYAQLWREPAKGRP